MSFQVKSVGDATVITLVDEQAMHFERLQATSNELDRLIRESETEKVVVDFQHIVFYNSMTLGLLVSKQTKARDAGKQLWYCNLSKETMWAVQATQLQRLLQIADNLGDVVETDADESDAADDAFEFDDEE
jgi:anti-anti-sigma factor